MHCPLIVFCFLFFIPRSSWMCWCVLLGFVSRMSTCPFCYSSELCARTISMHSKFHCFVCVFSFSVRKFAASRTYMYSRIAFDRTLAKSFARNNWNIWMKRCTHTCPPNRCNFIFLGNYFCFVLCFHLTLSFHVILYYIDALCILISFFSNFYSLSLLFLPLLSSSSPSCSLFRTDV